MAKQESILRFTGNIDNLSFFKGKDGYSARKKGGVSGNRIKSDPRYERTRENMEEFSRAAAASKLLRRALKSSLMNKRDGGLTPRLTASFLKVIKSDGVSRRGQRHVTEGDLGLLREFEFNLVSPLSTTFSGATAYSIDRTQGTVGVVISELLPETHIEWPEGSTHCRISSSAVELDFAARRFVLSEFEGEPIGKDAGTQAEFTITHNVTPGSALPVVVVLGIQFFQFMNGELYPLKNGSFNALSLVEAYGGE